MARKSNRNQRNKNSPKTKPIARELAVLRREAQEFETMWRARSLKATLKLRRDEAAKKSQRQRRQRQKVLETRALRKISNRKPVESSSDDSSSSAPAIVAASHPSIKAPKVSLPSLAVSPASPSIPAISNPMVRKSSKAKPSGSFATPAFGTIDVCFCLDATGSMTSYIQQAKQTIDQLIAKISSKVMMQGIDIKFAVVAYRDHPPQDSTFVTRSQDFTDQKTVHKFLATLSAAGGGDEPQATHDGLMESCSLSWRNTPGIPMLRYIFHITDAPPHGKEFVPHEPQEGCTCGLKTDDILNIINRKDIHFRLIKTMNGNPRLDKMHEMFEQRIANFEATTIQHAGDMDIRVSDMVIRELVPDNC